MTSQTTKPSRFQLADLPSSLVVFLVAVPLALGIANASGAPIASGLIGCIVGGIVAGLLSGAPLQVSGPAAGLTVLVYGMVQKFGWTTMCAISLVAGIFQLCFGALKIARASLMISPAVVHGMLAGIGITISLAQLHVMLGGKPQSSAVLNLKELPTEVVQLYTHPTAPETHAAILGIITIAILVGWGYLPAKVRLIPAAIVSVLTATILGNVFFPEAPRVAIKDGSLFVFQLPQLPADIGGFFVAALTIAVVASVESLLCAMATDKLHTGPRANLDKELIAQGATNLISGLLGGLPVTGVIVRSAANVAAGGKTRVSSILHGVWVLLFVLLATSQLNKIPLAALAGLLIHVGVRLINLHHIRELHLHREVIVYTVTALGVAFLNLLAGVGLGIGLAVILLLRRLANFKSEVESRDGGIWHVRIEGALNFLTVPQLSATLAKIPEGSRVEIDLLVEFMDHAAFEALHSWRKTYEKTGGTVDIDEKHESWYGDAKGGSPRVTRATN